MKLWQKSVTVDQRVEQFTVGSDRTLDLQLAPFDILGSIAHIQMLRSIDLLTGEECDALRKELVRLYGLAVDRELTIEEGTEDIHSQVEHILTDRLGETGKKIHSGRSRNDQVLVDLKMFFRSEIEGLVRRMDVLVNTLLEQAEKHREVLIPGYTHMQVAMPSSIGLWLGAYAESLTEDLVLMRSAFEICNKNPLGSGAGYGSSFPLDRELTTALLGFQELNYNVVYAQMTRGKSELVLSQAMAAVALTLSRLSMDICLYMGPNFGFVSFPDELTTGSSIMPHKKNPDIFELIRGRCNQLMGLPNELQLILSNLPSGYHRDLQQLKEHLFPGLETIKGCLEMTDFAIAKMEVRDNVLEDPKYDHLFTVEEVNRLVLQGKSFRDAYREVGKQVEEGTYVPNRKVQHQHSGSMGNPAFEEIRAKKERELSKFPFHHINECFRKLTEI